MTIVTQQNLEMVKSARTAESVIGAEDSRTTTMPANLRKLHQMAEETVAKQALKELIMMPCPKTDKDFRRAIMMAVLIGQQMECDQSSNNERIDGASNL